MRVLWTEANIRLLAAAHVTRDARRMNFRPQPAHAQRMFEHGAAPPQRPVGRRLASHLRARPAPRGGPRSMQPADIADLARAMSLLVECR
jgi:hypothetical protein